MKAQKARIAYIDRREAKARAFDVEGHIERRQTTEPWITVEIGPALRPSGLNRRFTNKSAYIALEAGINNQWPYYDKKTYGETADVFEKIRQSRPQENIFLIEDRAIDGSQFGRREFGEQANHYQLPDEFADEIMISYVLDDPETNWELVTSEAVRMLKPGGHLVIFDSCDVVFDRNLDNVGLDFEFSTILDGRTSAPAAQFGLYQTNPDILNIETESVPPAMLIMSKPL